MATYLYMDGVDDYIVTPSMVFNEIVLDFSFKPKAGIENLYFQGNVSGSAFKRITSGLDRYDGYWNQTYVNGVLKSWNTVIIPNDERVALRILRTSTGSLFNNLNIFSNVGGTYGRTEGNLYSVKFYNDNVLVAHYDMSTGTVQDQSGNGRHATLVGGTWMNDGIGGEPQGEDVTATFAMSQQLYKDTAEPYGLKQSIFADTSASYETVQRIYQDMAEHHPLRNILFADKTVTYPMLQTFFQEGMMRSGTFAVKVQVYADKQQNYPLRQELYEAISDHVALKQVMYADKAFNAELRQVISRQLSQNISTLQRMYDDKQADYPLLIQMLSDYKVYNQIVEGEMFICREFNKDMTITRVVEKEMRI